MIKTNFKRILLYILILIRPCLLIAGQVTIENARRVADVHSQFGRTVEIRSGRPQSLVPEFSVREVTPVTAETDQVLFYVAELEPEGFIAISSKEDITPVIAYSYRRDFCFQSSDENILLGMLISDAGMRIDALKVTDDKVLRSNRELWSGYLEEGVLEDYIGRAGQWPDRSRGWLDTAWHQSAPYNDLVPVDPSTGKRAVAGCVATAIAQIVNYHKYPKSIALDDFYDSYTTETRKIRIPDDFSELGFPSFSVLNGKLGNINYFDPSEGFAPALNFACGILVEMDYTSTSSGARMDSAHRIFTDRLGYDRAEFLLEDTNPGFFYSTIISDMKEARPALLAIFTDSYYGHAIVVDGYRETGMYHLNFGWGSKEPDPMESCWYSLPEGMPAGFSVVAFGITEITSPDQNPYNRYREPVSYPNPFRLSSNDTARIALPSTPDGVIESVRIYSASGSFVRELEGGDLFADWDGRNASGRRCAPGLYFYVVRTSGNGVHRGRMTLVP